MTQTLSQLRSNSGLTQQELADKIGICRATLVRWEAGAKIFPKNRERLAQALGCGIRDLNSAQPVRSKVPPGKKITAIQQYRKKAGLTQRELADRAGIDQQKLSRLERGSLAPDPDLIDRLAVALKIPASRFAAREDRPAPATPAPTPKQAAVIRKNAALDDPSTRYVQLLAHYRSAAKLTLGELANQSGIPQSRVSAMENGLAPILGEDLIALADTLNVLPDDLRSSPVGLIDPCSTLAQFYDTGGRLLDEEILMPAWMHQRAMQQLGIDDAFILKQAQLAL